MRQMCGGVSAEMHAYRYAHDHVFFLLFASKILLLIASLNLNICATADHLCAKFQ